MSYPYFPYAITEVYCLIFAATIWFRLNNSLGSEHEVRQLRNMIYSYFGMLLPDIFWAFTEDGILHLPHLLNASINAVTIIAVSCGCYFWFRFIEDRLRFGKRSLDMLLRIPLCIVCSLDALSIFTGWIFYIDASGHYQSRDIFILPTIVNYFYLLIPTIFASHRALKAHTRQERSEYLTYALYMIAPLISGTLEDTFPHVPILALNIFMMILILFLMIQNMQVNNDALTGLNNRNRLNWYLKERLPRVSSEHPLLLFILDVNCFKYINDTYGHLEGDHALQVFSTVLKDIAAKYYAFAARYGGDEFCIVLDAGEHTPQEVLSDIQLRLQHTQIQKLEGHQCYSISASAGFAVCDQAENPPDLLVANADKMLYENKKEWHSHNQCGSRTR